GGSSISCASDRTTALRLTGHSAFAEYDSCNRGTKFALRHALKDLQTMILIGQYDSPFVRRVAIALRLYGLPFEHRPWSTFGDGDKIAPYNPLRRVPTLVLDSGEALIESSAILDYLDDLVGPDRAMIAPRGEARRHALRICALATGLADKAVSLVYE